MHSYIKIIIPILSYFTLSTQYRTYNILLFPSDSFLILLPWTFKRLIIILFYCFMQQPDMKGEITIGSPRNITLNTLNGNQFFTLDYEGKEAFSKTVLMENYYI